jgi:hypothetical protein
MVLVALIPGLGVGSAVPAGAQEADAERAAEPKRPLEPFTASPYLPLNDQAYPILEYWIAAGRINSLSPFVKPYRRIDVARALEIMTTENVHQLPVTEFGRFIGFVTRGDVLRLMQIRKELGEAGPPRGP